MHTYIQTDTDMQTRCAVTHVTIQSLHHQIFHHLGTPPCSLCGALTLPTQVSRVCTVPAIAAAALSQYKPRQNYQFGLHGSPVSEIPFGVVSSAN